MVKINIGRNRLLFGNIYRRNALGRQNSDRLLELISRASDYPVDHLIFVGDFNYPEINWGKNEASGGPDSAPNKFI